MLLQNIGAYGALNSGVQRVHDLQGEGSGAGIGVGLAGHVLHALVKARVAERDRGIAVVEELVDGLTFFESCARAVLPENGRRVGERALQAVVTAAQRAVAELKTLFKIVQNFSMLPPEESATSGRLIVTTP